MGKINYLSEAQKMSYHYKKLYIIENILRSISKESDSLYFHEYIPLLDQKIYSDNVKADLYKLIKIRNKICHMNEIDATEEELLDKILRFFTDNNEFRI